MSEEIRDIKDSISFLAETQRILSENILLQQRQFNEFQQVLNSSLQESARRQQETERRLIDAQQETERRLVDAQQEADRRFNASQSRLEAILLNQQSQMQLLAERQAESDQRFNVVLQEIRHIGQRVDRVE